MVSKNPCKSRLFKKKLDTHLDTLGIKIGVQLWYTGRDSNPQPSEPESDALSIEPPVHLLDSLCIIAGFSLFVKPIREIFSPKIPLSSAKVVVFRKRLWYNL